MGTPIALVAVLVAVGTQAYGARLVERRKLIETAPESERAALLDAATTELGKVGPATLTKEQRSRCTQGTLVMVWP